MPTAKKTSNKRRYAFVSYSRGDSTFALRMARDLRQQGIEVWLDQLDIPPGKNWDREVEIALRDATFMLLVVSENSIKSDEVRDEISYALDHQTRIIPVVISHVDVPLRLYRLQRVDFTSDYERALSNLVLAIGGRGQREEEFAAALAVPRPAGVAAVPTFMGEIGHGDKSNAFFDFIVEHDKHVVALDVYMRDDEFDADPDSDFFVLWNDSDKNSGVEYNLPRRKKKDNPVLWHSRGVYRVQGFFLIGGLAGPNQGLFGVDLELLDSKQVAVGNRV